MSTQQSRSSPERWARFRFSVIGQLLASPPKRGELAKELKKLSERHYRHPTKPHEWLTIGVSTLEKWYYQVLRVDDPIAVLRRKVRCDAGLSKAMTPALLVELEAQYKRHRSWSYQLHRDNLEALVQLQPTLGSAPSYSTVYRRMQERGWHKQRKRRKNETEGQKAAAKRLDKREVRGFEASHVHGLWHLDYHEGSRRVVDEHGCYHTPEVFAVLDDRARLCCHLQWYLTESAQTHFHGLSQAFHKRGLPRALMEDNGGAMTAAETRNGLERLGIAQQLTLSYSPYQNGKQEDFWGLVEGRLLAMLEHVEPLTLAFLNRASQAWVELEYNRRHHSEIGTSPLQRMLAGPDVSRPAPDSERLRFAFSVQESRTQRKSDGTISIKGVRFEVPNRFRHLRRLQVRYQRWDLSRAYLVDPRTDALLAPLYPQDKAKNADGRRRLLEPVAPVLSDDPPAAETEPLPPLMRKLLADYAATGLPPAYLPKDELEPPPPQEESNDDQ
jgi:transposase InsO family protein